MQVLCHNSKYTDILILLLLPAAQIKIMIHEFHLKALPSA